MKDAREIRALRAIAHILDHRKGRLILSEQELALTQEPTLQQYFDQQVNNALVDPAVRSHNFVSKDDTSTAALCYAALDGQADFIGASQKLGERLFNAMRTDQRIVPGNFVVCLYGASNYLHPFLALMKLDPSRGLIARARVVGTNRHVVGFDIQDEVMPTAREKLQKVALVQGKSGGTEYELLLLDRQTSKDAANFFARDFLNVVPALDAITRTERLAHAIRVSYNQLTGAPVPGRPHLDPKQAEQFLQANTVMLEMHQINVDAWVDGLVLHDDAKALIRKNIEAELPDREFEIDPEYAKNNLIQKRRYRGDFGFLFEIESEHFNDVVTKKEEDLLPDGTPVARLTIQVPNFRLVKR